VGAAFRLCQLGSSSLVGNSLLPVGYSQGYRFSESLIVLMESGLEVCDDGVQVVSALGFASLVAEFADSIVQSALRHTSLALHFTHGYALCAIPYILYFSRKRGVRNNLICFDRLTLIWLVPRPRMDSQIALSSQSVAGSAAPTRWFAVSLHESRSTPGSSVLT
jgi:hypothetical protein